MAIFSRLHRGSTARNIEHSVPGPSQSPAGSGDRQPSVRQNISSGSPPHVYAVDIPTPQSKVRQHWKPWLDLRNFWVHIQERRERTRLFFFRKKVDQVPQKIQRDAMAASMPDSTILGNNISERDNKNIGNSGRDDVLEGNEMGARGDEPTQGIQTPVAGMRDSQLAFAVHRIPPHEEGTAQGRLSIDSSESTTSPTAMGISGHLQQTLKEQPDMAHSKGLGAVVGPSDARKRVSSSWVVPNPLPDCSEFISSAVMVKEPSGDLRAVKLWYDAASADNWVSEKFVKDCGLAPRPFLNEDVFLYSTVKGDVIPTHYVELEVQDQTRGMAMFDKLKLNVTPHMQGIGLLAGRVFINKHNIVLTPGEPRDSYVATRRRPNAQELKEHKELMKQADEEYELAKALESTTGSTSDAAARSTSSADEQVASSSPTSTSIPKTSDNKSKGSKGE